MSIYKSNPSLSVDFVILPLEVAFTSVIEKYRGKVLDNEDRYEEVLTSSPIVFYSDFNTSEKRLYGKLANRFCKLGSSNTQLNSGLTENTGSPVA